MKGETFDSAATKIFTNIVDSHAEMSDRTTFQQNLCENPKIISFMRTNSEKLKKIYLILSLYPLATRIYGWQNTKANNTTQEDILFLSLSPKDINTHT